MFCTMSPCEQCAIAIIQSGISSVIYGTAYRLPEGLIALDDAGIHVCDIEELNKSL